LTREIAEGKMEVYQFKVSKYWIIIFCINFLSSLITQNWSFLNFPAKFKYRMIFKKNKLILDRIYIQYVFILNIMGIMNTKDEKTKWCKGKSNSWLFKIPRKVFVKQNFLPTKFHNKIPEKSILSINIVTYTQYFICHGNKSGNHKNDNLSKYFLINSRIF
jgi:hypothetical protein